MGKEMSDRILLIMVDVLRQVNEGCKGLYPAEVQ
jgi:hypothetical protein